MKRMLPWLVLILVVLGSVLLLSNFRINAVLFGVRPENGGIKNSQNLQKLIDWVSPMGGTIYIPAGEYEFAQNGTQTIGAHCIKMRSNVRIVGDGERTVLKPMGESVYGLDMFYYNDYLDLGQADYLENCVFEDFVIDAIGTSCQVYTSAGKGFMFNLFRNCHWNGVTVRNTDATGFGVDCPLDSSIVNCWALNCGKAADPESTGASGFGIGFGFSDDESIRIEGCYAEGNAKFGFFFEHQGRFDPQRYQAKGTGGFAVLDSTARENRYNFGGIAAFGGVYENCTSTDALCDGCYFENCSDFRVTKCVFLRSGDYDIRVEGQCASLVLTENRSDTNRLLLGSSDDCEDAGNSWNE